jgi:hypothetical protein
MEEAIAALQSIAADYERHCRAAREIAEAWFDAGKIVDKVLSVTMGDGMVGSARHDPHIVLTAKGRGP